MEKLNMPSRASPVSRAVPSTSTDEEPSVWPGVWCRLMWVLGRVSEVSNCRLGAHGSNAGAKLRAERSSSRHRRVAGTNGAD